MQLFTNLLKMSNNLNKDEALEETLWGILFLISYNNTFDLKFNFSEAILQNMNLDKNYINNPEFLNKISKSSNIRIPFGRILGELLRDTAACKFLNSIGIHAFFEKCFNMDLKADCVIWWKELIWILSNFFIDNTDYIIKTYQKTEIFETIFKIAKKHMKIKALLREALLLINLVFNSVDSSQGMKIVIKVLFDLFNEIIMDESNYKNEILSPLFHSMYIVFTYGENIKKFTRVNPLVDTWEKSDGFTKLESLQFKGDYNDSVKYALSALLDDYGKDDVKYE